MNAQLVSQRDWQPEPTKNLVTSVPVKEGLKLGKIKSVKRRYQTIHENVQHVSENGLHKKPEHVNSWRDIEGLSWLFLDDVEDY